MGNTMDEIKDPESREAWERATDEQKKRYLAKNPDGPPGYDASRLKYELQAMKFPFVCEEGDTYDTYDWVGVSSEAEVIDKLLEPIGKQGQWNGFRYHNERWEIAVIKRLPDNTMRLFWESWEP